MSSMKDLIKAFRKIPEKNRLIVYGIGALVKNFFYFLFKVIVGIIFKSPFLIAMAVYNVLIGIVKANCSRGLLKNKKDDYKDLKTYIQGGVILTLSSIFYLAYVIIQLFFESNVQYNMFVAIAIAGFACYAITVSIIGVVKNKGKTMIVKEYKLTNFATAFTNVVLAQVAILSFTTDANMYRYNAIIGIIVGSIILLMGLYLTINGLIMRKVYTTGITNAKKHNNTNNNEETQDKKQESQEETKPSIIDRYKKRRF